MKKEGLIALIIGIVGAILLAFMIPNGAPSVLIWFINTGIVYFIVKKTQGEILETHEDEGNEFYSVWRAVGIALICAFVWIGIELYAHHIDREGGNFDTAKVETLNSNSSYGKSETFNGTEVFYTSAVTLNEVNRLGQFLIDYEYTNGTDISTQLNKTGKTYEFRIAVGEEIEYDQEDRNEGKLLAAEISEVCFNGAQVDVYFCNKNFETLIVLPMKILSDDEKEYLRSNQKTGYFKYYNYQRYNGDDFIWKDLDVKIIFGKKEIKVVTTEKTNTFIIVGSPEYDCDEYFTDLHFCDITYNVYRSNDTNKKTIRIWRESGTSGVCILDDNNKSREYFSNQNYR